MDNDQPMFVISVAAELAGMHPQTLRQYDRLGLVTPTRSAGRSRRYSHNDVRALREVQRLSQEEGINLAGIKRIMDLQRQVRQLEREVANLAEQTRADHRVFAAGQTGDVVAVRRGRRPQRRTMSSSLVLWRPQR